MATTPFFVPTVPGSRSISARALICAALARGRSEIVGLADCDDTTAMINVLSGCGVRIAGSGDVTEVWGSPKPAFTSDVMDCFASGTTMRFAAALSVTSDQPLALTGSSRLMERPMRGLTSALRTLGKTVDESEPSGRRITGAVTVPAVIVVDAEKSGQFVSGLLMALAAVGAPTRLCARKSASIPFIDMTVSVMRAFGADIAVRRCGDVLEFELAGTGYRPTRFTVEPDIMSANYFLAATLITGGPVFVPDLATQTIQGDVAMLAVLEKMGAVIEWRDGGVLAHRASDVGLAGTLVDVTDIPDMTLTLGVVAATAHRPSMLTGVQILRYKESDRLAALTTELGKIGVATKVSGDDNTITITPPNRLMPAEIATYDDHRMAMSFALLTLVEPHISILDPGCVSKTWPDFFTELERYRTHVVSSAPS